MTSSYLIWVPSRQKYIRFREITFFHLKCLDKAKSVSHVEFLYCLTEILKEIIVKPEELPINTITVIDKYVIFLYLKMLCVGTTFECYTICPTCDKRSKTRIDLNSLIVPLSKTIDRNFRTEIKTGNYTFICDQPTIERELELETWFLNSEVNLTKHNLSENYIIQLVNCIKQIKLQGELINFESLPISTQFDLISSIQTHHTNQIYKKFIQPMNKEFHSFDLFQGKCSDKKCAQTSLTFDFKSINDILKFVLGLKLEEYNDNILFLCKGWNFTPEYLDKCTLGEIELLINNINKIKEEEKARENPDQITNSAIEKISQSSFANFQDFAK